MFLTERLTRENLNAVARKTIDLLPKDFRSEIFRFRARKMKNEEAYLS
jgi:hypothetical protein